MGFEFLRQKQKLKLGVSSDGRPSKTYTLGYLFSSDSATELSVVDVAAILQLQPGSPFSEDPNATLGDIEIDRLPTVEPHCFWNVDIVYATNAKVPENDSQEPTQQRVKRSARYSETTEYIIKDRHGTLIVNTAGDPFSDGIPARKWPRTFTYEWNRATPTIGFHGTINKNTFNGCEPGTLVCLIDHTEEFEGGYSPYWRETIVMIHDPNGWQPRPLNAGFKSKRRVTLGGGIGTIDYYEDILDSHLQKVDVPSPLDANGAAIPLSQRPDACIYIDVDHLPETEFELIGVREFPV